MAQHDGVISNASGAAVRADLNNALAALITNSSGATSPGTTYSFQFWADTTTGQLKIRNAANSAWITLMELDGTMLMEDGTVSAPGLAFASDLNTGFFRSAADKINFATGGAERLEIGSSEVVFNDPSNDVDFRVESNGNTHMLFVDAGNDRIGIGTSAPDSLAHLRAASGNAVIRLENSNTSVASAESLGSIEWESNDASTGGAGVAAKLNVVDDNGFGTAYGMTFSTGLASAGSMTLSEQFRIDSSGRLLVGTTTATNNLRLEQSLAIVNEGAGTNGGAGFTNYGGTNADAASIVDINRSRGTTDGTMTAVASGDTLGFIQFRGADGTNFIRSAQIVCEVDGTPGTNDMPGRLILGTTAGGASSPTERVRIDSSGRLLLGTTTEGQASADNFTIADSAHCGMTIRSGTTSEGAIYFSDGTSGDAEYRGQVLYDHDGNYMRFSTDASERMRIDSSGQVGIGSSSPGHELVVRGSQPFLELRSSDTGNHAAEDVFSGILFGTDDTSTSVDPHGFIKAVHTRAGSGHSSADAGLTFGTSASTTAPATERMRLDTSGRLGIGTASPNDMVSINSAGSSATGRGITINAAASGDTAGVLRILSDSGTQHAEIGAYTNNLIISADESSAALQLKTAGTERMRINSNGKILCGATSPVTFTTTNGLEVHSSNNGGALVLRNTSATAGQFWRIGPETNNTLVVYSSNATGVFITHTGSTWSPNTSDLRIKDVVGTFDQTTSWNVLKGLQIKEWWFKNESTEHREANTPHVGPIAQELHALDPNLRLESPGGIKAETFGQDFDGAVYTYDNDLLLKHALSALNQAIAKIETLETKVAALEAG